jgi:uncharacterized membrane protein YdjX (TVP38/TMEM64 family)
MPKIGICTEIMNPGYGKSERPGMKRWIGLVLVIIVLLISVRILPVADWLARLDYWVAHLGVSGVLLFILVYIVATVLLFPASVLTVGAGFIFGVFVGTAVVSIAATAGASLAFLIARYLARGQIERKVVNNPRFSRIDRAIGERGAKLVFLLRLSPVIPFNLSNYFYGLTSVKFWPYVMASWIGMLPGTLLYVYLGATGKASLSGAAGQTGTPGSMRSSESVSSRLLS